MKFLFLAHKPDNIKPIHSIMPTKLLDSDYEDFLKENKNVYLYFTASWCGPCKKMKPHYEKAETDLKALAPDLNFIFALIDVDEAQKMATAFAIDCMPTLILIKDGTIVDRSKGAVDCAKILSSIEKHFGTTNPTQTGTQLQATQV